MGPKSTPLCHKSAARANPVQPTATNANGNEADVNKTKSNDITMLTELKTLPQWVCWRLEIRDGKPTKVPINPHTGSEAKSNDPTTWDSFEGAQAAHRRLKFTSGIGFVFTQKDAYCGIDLDKIRDPQTRAIKPWAQDIINSLGSYAEISPSGTGVHVFIKGKKPGDKCKKGMPESNGRKTAIEIYDHDRYFTVTENHLDGTPTRIEERQEALEKLYQQIFGAANEPPAQGAKQDSTGTNSGNEAMSDAELLRHARGAKNGSKFAALWKGNTSGYPSHSEADLALCCALAFWTGKDAVRIDRLFRQSGLYREKWDRTDYGQRTIARAIAVTTEVYAPKTIHDASTSWGDAYEDPDASGDASFDPPPEDRTQMPDGTSTRVWKKVHLVDLERTELIGKEIETEIIIAGIGEVFHVPKKWKACCATGDNKNCACPKVVELQPDDRILLQFCRLQDANMKGLMRAIAGCKNAEIQVLEYVTISELLATPVADINLDSNQRDYREKSIAYVGTLQSSNVRYLARGKVLGEPKKQRASMLVTELIPLKSEAERFEITEALNEKFEIFQRFVDALEACQKHVKNITRDITHHITKVYGEHRERILLIELLAYHSPIRLSWQGCEIKGTLDVLIVGDTGQGKTTGFLRLCQAVNLGRFISGSSSSRTGMLYHLDSKVNDRRILRWGAYPLAHKELLAVDEAQKLSREQWEEFSTARSEGVLRVDRTIRGEHPSQVRLVCFANPPESRSMSSFQYGIEAIAPEIGFLRDADIRRFDIVAIVSKDDEPMNEITKLEKDRAKLTQEFTPDLLRASVLWAWTRKPENFIYGEGTPEKIRDLSRSLYEKYANATIPLVITDIHEKLIRWAFSFAALLHSTDENHETVICKPVHVELAEGLLQGVYAHGNCLFDQYAKVNRLNSQLSDAEYKTLKEEFFSPGSTAENLDATTMLLECFLTGDAYSRVDLEAQTGLGKDAMLSRLKILRIHKLIVSKKRGYCKTTKFIQFLRTWNETR